MIFDPSLAALVWRRAKDRCEYCQLLQSPSSIPFEIDHVIARKHGGATEAMNLALSCFYCNSHKGPNIAGIDPQSRRIVRLYNHPDALAVRQALIEEGEFPPPR